MNGRAAIVFVAPVVLAAGLVYHPSVAVLTDTDAIAAAAAVDTTRWAVAHLAVGVGAGLLMLAFLTIRSHLRDAGEDRWSRIGLPFVVFGGTLYAMVQAMEFASLAAAETGGDVAGAQAAIGPWMLPTNLIGALALAVGVVSFAVAIARSAILSRPATTVVVTALTALALARFVPLGAVQFYVVSALSIIALWPLGIAMARQPAVSQPATPGTVSPAPSTTTSRH